MTEQRPSPSALAVYGAFAVVCVVTLAAYARSFAVPFQFDDYGHIVNNQVIRGHSVGEFLSFGRTRIIPFSTLAVNYWIGGESTVGYHVVNFAVHLLATLAVYQLALALCRTPRLRESWLAEHRLLFAIAAAFLLACHPIQVQAVTYIVQRISAMATLFYVASVLCYVRGRNAELGIAGGHPRRWYVAMAFCALAALLSKENAASLPLALLLTEWIFYANRSSSRSWRRIVLVAALIVLIPLSWSLLPPVFQKSPSTDSSAPVADSSPPDLNHAYRAIRFMIFRAEGSGRVSSLQYLLTECVVIPRYLRLVFVPYGFNVDHDPPIAKSLSVEVAGGAVLLIALITLGIYARRRWPLVSYGILWVFVALSIESSIVPIRDPMVEHRMYLAMPGIALGVAAGFVWLMMRMPAAATITGVGVVGALSFGTFTRNEVWQTPLALWGDAVDKAPDKARPHVNLATALHKQGHLDQAIAHYCRALKLEPSNDQAKSNLNALVDEQVDERMKSGREFVLGGVLGADGTLELEPRDPCQGQ